MSDKRSEELIDYLVREVILEQDVVVAPDTPLVSAGLIDSFALIDVLTRLEQVTGMRIPIGRVGPADLDTVEKMLETARRVGIRKS